MSPVELRFAELRWAGLAAAVALIAGCASSNPGATAPTGAASAPKPVAKMDAATQQSYDAALQALRAGRAAEAEASLATLVKAHPELPGPQANLGLLQRQAGHLPESLKAFDAAIALQPDVAVLHNQRGITLRAMGRFADARSAYEKALSLDADYANAALNLGILLDLYLDDAPAALAQYQRYLTLTPAGDAVVSKWVTELKNRKPTPAAGKETAS